MLSCRLVLAAALGAAAYNAPAAVQRFGARQQHLCRPRIAPPFMWERIIPEEDKPADQRVSRSVKTEAPRQSKAARDAAAASGTTQQPMA